MNQTRTETLMNKIAQTFSWVAGAALILMMMLVVIDVILRRLIPGVSLYGSIEIAVICVVVIAYCGLAWSFLAGSHITVEVATGFLPSRIQAVMDAFWMIVAAMVCLFFAYHVYQTGRSIQASGEVTEILRLSPMWSYGTGTVGLCLAAVAALISAGTKFRNAGS